MLHLLSACLLLASTPATTRASDEDIYTLAKEVTGSVEIGDKRKTTEYGGFDPVTLGRLKSSDIEWVRNLVPIAQDYDALRLDHEVRHSPAAGKRPKYGFEYDDILWDSVPGLQLPYQGWELQVFASALRNSE